MATNRGPLVEKIEMQPRFTHSSKGKLSEMSDEEDMRFWLAASPEARVKAAIWLSWLYYEVFHPGTGAARLDKSVGGKRFLRDGSPD
jgi:hypothetical protein